MITIGQEIETVYLFLPAPVHHLRRGQSIQPVPIDPRNRHAEKKTVHSRMEHNSGFDAWLTFERSAYGGRLHDLEIHARQVFADYPECK